MIADITPQVERTVTVTMTEIEAANLLRALNTPSSARVDTYKIFWLDNLAVGSKLYDALRAAGVEAAR